MKHKVIQLLRHGEPQGGDVFRGVTDHPLTPLGWQQLQRATHGKQWDLIITSPLKRCADFAEQLAAQLQTPLIYSDDLKEFNFGIWENQDRKTVFDTDFEQIKGLWLDPMHFASPAGESVLNFEARILTAWFGCLARPESNILVVCHGGVIRMILKEILGMPFTHINRLEVPFASSSVIRVNDTEPYYYNLLAHGCEPASIP